MAQHKIKISQVINDFQLTMDGDDYASNVSDIALRNFALRGVREIGFDLGKKIKSLKLPITSNNTVPLPNDFVDISKLGIVDSDGILRVFGNNKNINYSRKYSDTDDGFGGSGSILPTVPGANNQYISSEGLTTNTLSLVTNNEANDHVIASNNVLNTQSDKGATTGASGDPDAGDLSYHIFNNYLHQGGSGQLYGAGGGHLAGDYRLNLDENRIEVDTNNSYSEVVLEYIADEARSSDPEVHAYAEEALRSYIYYKIVERKSSVPSNEKARARSEYYNERRKANARLGNFTKEEALRTIRKNFMQAPKY